MRKLYVSYNKIKLKIKNIQQKFLDTIKFKYSTQIISLHLQLEREFCNYFIHNCDIVKTMQIKSNYIYVLIVKRTINIQNCTR